MVSEHAASVYILLPSPPVSGVVTYLIHLLSRVPRVVVTAIHIHVSLLQYAL